MTRLVLCALFVGGQIHVEQYGLKEVKARGEPVVVGTVDAGKIRVKRVYGGSEPAPGTQITPDIYIGVQMTDPHRHVLDSRFRSGLGALPKPGTAVVVVQAQGKGVEIAVLTADVQRVLDVLYQPALQRDAVARLEADLKLPDIAELAAQELERRNALRPAALLDADAELLTSRYDAMTDAARDRFVTAILPITKTDRRRRITAVRATLKAPRAALVDQLDWNDRDERQLLEDDVRLALLETTGDLSSFGRYLAEAAIRRPSHRATDDELPALLERCDQPTRAAIAARFLAAIFTSARATKTDFDGFLLDQAVRLAKAAPSAALWAPLAKLRPLEQPVTSEKVALLTALIEIAVALAPLDQAKARDLVEPHLNQGVDVDEALAKQYAETIGPLPAKPPAQTILELRPGQTRRLPSGERVSLKREDRAVVVIITNADGSGEERLIEDADPYREWWLPPYVVIVKRVGGAMNLRFTPAADDPALSPAEAHTLAKAICDKRGADGEVTQDPREFDGVYVYTVAGARRCLIRVGLRTRKVLP